MGDGEGFSFCQDARSKAAGGTWHGVACVPRRAVRAFPRKQQIRVHPLPVPLVRELAVITPARPEQPRHVTRFLENILFS